MDFAKRQGLLRVFALLVMITVSSALPFTLLSHTVLAQDYIPKTSSSTITSIDRENFLVDTTFSPKLVVVKYKTDTYQYFSHGITIHDALIENNLPHGEDFEIRPAEETLLTSQTVIFIDDLTSERKSEIEDIPYQSITVDDNNLELDTTQVVQTGRTGKKQVIYEYIYRNGVLENKVSIREEVIETAQDEITALGKKKVFREMTIDGVTFTYWKVMHVFATSYDWKCLGCNHYTATGAYLTKGICAADPKVIPFHRSFYVPGYGQCKMEDTGGAIKGNKIDLGFEDLDFVRGQWSARWVDIYLMD
jgi:3D (Asp-Asp-Asp) domain-containing protein